MFDDQPINNQNPSPPNNLPIGEPEDMFASVDGGDQSAPVASQNQALPNSALGAGVLKPKMEEPLSQDNFSRPDSNMPPQAPMDNVMENNTPTSFDDRRMDNNDQGNVVSSSVPSSVHPQEIYQIKEPAIGKGIVRLVVVGVVVVILGGGSWWIYNSFIKDTSNSDVFNMPTDFEDVNTQADFTDQNMVDETPIEDVVVVDETLDNNFVVDDLSDTVVDDQVLFGEPIDKDVDGLDDDTERNIGTDPNNWDSDGDELSDGDEVSIWKTDPLNPDTDGDTYLDGAEIKSGYSPTGPGKLFEPPTEEEVII